MARVEFDLYLFRRQLQAKAERLESPRLRQMIAVFSEHTAAEIDGDLDRVMATMTPDPIFYVHHPSGDSGPKGWDAVKAMYAEMFASRMNYMEMDYQCIVVDDDTVMVEFKQRKIIPGRLLTPGSAWTDAVEEGGERVDPAAYYLSQGRAVVIAPFDAQCRMMGEHSFGGPKPVVRRLAAEELPGAYRDRFNASGPS
jgi:hypothetical protein